MSVISAKLRVHGKIPHVITIGRSIAMQVRDAAIARLELQSFFAGFTFRRSHAFKLQANLMPYCAVYLMTENLTPDGNANTGEVRFSSELRLGFSVVMLNSDPDVMEDKLDNAYQMIFEGLLRDPTFYNNSRYTIEAFTRGNRQHVYGQIGAPQAHEVPWAELRADLYCDLGAIEYEPIIENMLESIHVETAHPPDDTANQHIYTIYDLDNP